MAVAATFLAGAGSRLLPPSIPFRFFGAAVAFHVVAWLAAMAGAEAVPRSPAGSAGRSRRCIAVTLGVLAMTAIGASLQLCRSRRGRPIAHAGSPAPSSGGCTFPAWPRSSLGMGLPSPALLAVGAVAVAVALVAFVVAARPQSVGRARDAARRRARLRSRRRRSSCDARHRARGRGRLRRSACRVDRATMVALHVALRRATASWACSRWASRTCSCRCSRSRPRPRTRGLGVVRARHRRARCSRCGRARRAPGVLRRRGGGAGRRRDPLTCG